MKHIALSTLLLLLPSLSHAAYGERWYNVEVIIFSYTSDSGLHEQKWPVETGKPDISNSVALIDTTTSINSEPTLALPGEIIEFERLPLEMLARAKKRLDRSSRYQVIYSDAWRLPDLPAHRATPVRIRAGQRYLEDGSFAPATLDAIPPASSATIPPVSINNAQPDYQQPVIDDALYEIDGRIKISLSKFLDVDADLLYRRNVLLPDMQGQMVNELRQFRLAEFRRMRSKTIHYLDHPMFGVVIGIDRYEPEIEEDAEVIQPGSALDINRQ